MESNSRILSLRFPSLAAALGLDNAEGGERLRSDIDPSIALLPAASGDPTLRIGEVYYHSRRDPRREGERVARDSTISGGEGCVFLCPTLAYIAEAYARASESARIVLVEPDVYLFAALLASRPLDPLLTHPGLALIVGLPPQETRAALEGIGANDLNMHVPSTVPPSEIAWLGEYREIGARLARKEEINRNTLRKFGSLWLGNMSRNLGELRDRDGIGRFEGIFPDQPALLLAAGPSLDEILPLLPELSKRCVVIAVDTALRACLSTGVQPDFIVLVDPQYWNWRHLDGTEAKDSFLITESAAWPAVFRYKARDIFLCSSLFPLGKFLEARTERKGELGAGGSVSTTAWDFARFLGCREILVAGLDLGFPNRQTHFKGSIFEERAHVGSSRLAPAETSAYRALYGACPYPVPDNRGATVLTDKRLSLYAWWFESKITAYPLVATKTLTHGGMRIPGISTEHSAAILERTVSRAIIKNRLERAIEKPYKPDAGKFAKAISELESALNEFASLAERAVKACGRRDARELERIDRLILAHPAKEIAAMVFEEDETEPGAPGIAGDNDPFDRSKAVYEGVYRAARLNLEKIAAFPR